jgi:DNA replication initiation complex subunit (GINS family)
MITYNDIYEAARKERYSEQLQPLNKNFVAEVSGYLKEKKEIASKEDDVFSDVIIKTKKQLENAITLFKELILRRRKKILTLVLIAAETGISKQDFENMLTIEKEMFEDLMKGIEGSDKKINELLNGKNNQTEKNDLVVFKEDIEELMDLEGDKIGPFDKGQVANIPKEIAKILIDDGKADLVME